LSLASVHLNLDTVEWKPLSEAMPSYPLDAAGAEAKLLNQDPDTGAFTMIVKLPAGTADAVRGSHASEEEMFLLEGDLTIDGATFKAPAYWHFSAGTIHGDFHTRGGATLIEAFKGPCDFTPATEQELATAPVSRGIDVDALEWKATNELRENYNYAGPVSKVLRGDPERTGFTSMAHLPASYSHPDLAYHQCTQEQFLLEGSVNETGKDRHALAYWCHPPGEVHGKSFTTDKSCTSLLIFDGPWEVTVVEEV
jgi:hypothetical protein